jgi:hypothetical protein
LAAPCPEAAWFPCVRPGEALRDDRAKADRVDRAQAGLDALVPDEPEIAKAGRAERRGPGAVLPADSLARREAADSNLVSEALVAWPVRLAERQNPGARRQTAVRQRLV